MSEGKKTWFRCTQVVLNLLELSLAIVCTGLIDQPMNDNMQPNVHHISLVSVAYASFIFVNTIVILGHLNDVRMPQLMVSARTSTHTTRDWSGEITIYKD
jgi:hypothetical protein